ncbi:hypothetical protein Tco_1390004 [Tanacetum coccineum]
MAEVLMKWRGLRDSPTDNHEDPMLERPRTGKSLDSLSPSRTSKGIRTLVYEDRANASTTTPQWYTGGDLEILKDGSDYESRLEVLPMELSLIFNSVFLLIDK